MDTQKYNSEEKKSGEQSPLEEHSSSSKKSPHQVSIFATFREKTTKIKLTICLVTFINFLIGIYFGIIGPFYPTIAKSRGLQEFTVGAVLAIFELFIFISSLVTPYVQIRVPTSILYSSFAVQMGLSNILFGFLDLTHDSIIFTLLSFLVRITEGIGAGFTMALSYAIMATIFPDKISTAIGLLEVLLALGATLGYIFGGILYTIGGFLLPLLLSGSFAVATGCCAFFTIPNMNTREEEREIEWRKFITHPYVIIGCLVHTMQNVTFGFIPRP